MRQRYGQHVLLRLAVCLGAMLLLSRCVGVAEPQTPALTPPAASGVESPSADVPPTATAAPSTVVEEARQLLQEVAESVGLVGQLLLLLGVLLVLAGLIIIVIARLRPRARVAKSETPAAAAPRPEQRPAAGDTREMSTVTVIPMLELRTESDGSAPDASWAVPLRGELLTIGRAPENDVVIDADLPGADSVSRQHARIVFRDGLWIVEDLESQNGVYVNGRRTGRNLLQDGWVVSIGGVQFVFHSAGGEVVP